MNCDNEIRVLAKSNPELTLKEHIQDCLLIYEQLMQCMPNLPIDEKNRFWSTLKISVICHDLCKAHPECQDLLLGKCRSGYNQRHELFSFFFVENFDVDNELKYNIRYTVIGNHNLITNFY